MRLSELELKYAVLTMVDRDDLLDGGAEHVALTVRALKRRRPEMLVETLVGDFRGRHDAVEMVVGAAPDVFAHNLEVTRAADTARFATPAAAMIAASTCFATRRSWLRSA